ncbi:MAG: ATP-binding cassette domain-containing protein [Spirochaetia bacterium]
MEKIIDAYDLTAYRGTTRVFDGLSISIEKRCNTAILGPNGSGKTTLLKLISREIHPVVKDSSRLRIFGKELYNVWNLRSRLGIVSHDLQQRYLEGALGINVLLSGYYAGNDISWHMEFTGEQRNRALEVMESLGISHLMERPFGEMSTGQQRRCLLGRALIHDPEALLLDEPTEGLDVQASFKYFETIRELMGRGKTVVLVTHHIHEILPEIKRVILLKEGAVAADGEKDEILTSARLSSLFEYPLRVLKHNGYFQAAPDR